MHEPRRSSAGKKTGMLEAVERARAPARRRRSIRGASEADRVAIPAAARGRVGGGVGILFAVADRSRCQLVSAIDGAHPRRRACLPRHHRAQPTARLLPYDAAGRGGEADRPITGTLFRRLPVPPERRLPRLGTSAPGIAARNFHALPARHACRRTRCRRPDPHAFLRSARASDVHLGPALSAPRRSFASRAGLAGRGWPF